MSYSFSPFLLSQWNLFASTFLSAGKLKFPLLSVVDTERRAVLSRSPVMLQSDPLTILSVTSISGFCPDELFVGVSVRLQKVSRTWLKGSSRAATLERPGVDPSMVGSPADSKSRDTEGDEE